MIKRLLFSKNVSTYANYSRCSSVLSNCSQQLKRKSLKSPESTYKRCLLDVEAVFGVEKRSFLDFMKGRSYGLRVLPGQGIKKKSEEEIIKEEDDSVVLRWMNKQMKEQEKSKGSFLPDRKLLRRIFFKVLLLMIIFKLTFEEIIELFEGEFEDPQIDRHLIPEKSGSLLLDLYQVLPLRLLSRIWGRLTSINLPSFLQVPLLSAYCNFFDVNLSEALVEDLSVYHNLGQFFRRPLKPEVRSISCDDVTSPADGKVLAFGEVHEGIVDSVKHLSYSLPLFLGPLVNKPEVNNSQNGYQRNWSAGTHPDEYQEAMMTNSNNRLYYCVIYLSPADCHRFFSPVQWTMTHRRHFPGELMSVSPQVVTKVPRLFAINERVVLSGRWKHGYFAVCPVGATNVGSIKIYEDLTLTTNRSRFKKGTFYDNRYGCHGYEMEKGEELGEFNLGSSIVMIFEAPKDTRFNLKKGQKICYGESVLNTNS